MPIKCKCSVSIDLCHIHDICKCSKIKKIISITCHECYLTNVKLNRCCSKCGAARRKKTVNPLCRKCYYEGQTERIISKDTKICDVFYNCGERNKYNYIRGHARRLIESLRIPKICACCTFKKGIQVCHIKPICTFSDDTPVNVVNSLENIILLCPNCHWLFDHGYNSLEELRMFYEVADVGNAPTIST